MKLSTEETGFSGCGAAVGCLALGAAPLVLLVLAHLYHNPLIEVSFSLMVGLMLLVGLLLFLGGCWSMLVSWRDYGIRRRTYQMTQRARGLDAEVEPGDIVQFAGRIVGGVVQAEPASDGRVRYGDHFILEDDRGRLVRLGTPGRGEVFGVCEANALVFAVGELAPRSGNGPFRSQEDVDMLIPGRAKILWVWVDRGNRERGLQELQVGFLMGSGRGALLLLFAGLAWFMGEMMWHSD